MSIKMNILLLLLFLLLLFGIKVFQHYYNNKYITKHNYDNDYDFIRYKTGIDAVYKKDRVDRDTDNIPDNVVKKKSDKIKMSNNTIYNGANLMEIAREVNSNYNNRKHHEKPNYQYSDLKNGWCYAGKDRQYRSCVYVGVNDKCMSGDIFPTEAVCINPTLRA